jgi:hypothetical protein
MLRAIETAWHQFGGRMVHVLPHIAEEPHGVEKFMVNTLEMIPEKVPVLGKLHVDDVDNTPLTHFQQLAILRKYSPYVEVDFQYANETMTDSKVSDWSAFERFMASDLLPNILSSDDASQDPFTIGVASHSNFMKDAFGREPKSKPGSKTSPHRMRKSACYHALPVGSNGRREKPHNNQALEFFYLYDGTTLTFDAEKGCRSLGASATDVGVPGKLKSICEADFARCIDRFPEGRDKKTTRGDGFPLVDLKMSCECLPDYS